MSLQGDRNHPALAKFELRLSAGEPFCFTRRRSVDIGLCHLR
jgi:hypothetical protein